MPSSAEIRKQVERETAVRARLAVPAFAGGFLYLLSSIVSSATQNGLPEVGPLQGLAPALEGVAKPAVSPRTDEIKFISHHAFQLIATSALAAVAILVLVAVLTALFESTSFRRPATWPYARLVVLIGGIGVAFTSVAHEIVGSIETHKFAVGHDFTNHAVEQALTKNTPTLIFAYLGLLASLALVVGMIIVLLNALRVGLVPRWMGLLGMFSGLLILLPNVGATLQLVPAFWLVMMGLLNAGKWPSGDPPAWAAGEARPWPSRAQLQAERAGKGAPAAAAAAAGDVAPAPTTPARSSGRRRRKRGGGS